MTKKLTDEDVQQINDIRETFAMFDKDKNGVITTKELGLVMRSFGFNPTVAEIKETMKKLDTNKNGKIEFTEFKDMMVNKYKNVDPELELINSFSVFDRNGNGFIDAKELYATLTNMGEKLTKEEAVRMIESADVNKDGKINYKEFSKTLAKSIKKARQK